jgi:hypothetical protein
MAPVETTPLLASTTAATATTYGIHDNAGCRSSRSTRDTTTGHRNGHTHHQDYGAIPAITTTEEEISDDAVSDLLDISSRSGRMIRIQQQFTDNMRQLSGQISEVIKQVHTGTSVCTNGVGFW